MSEQIRINRNGQANLTQAAVVARRLVGPDFKDHPSLKLADSVVHVVRTEPSPGVTEYIAGMEVLLTRDTFLWLIDSVAPNKLTYPTTSIANILDDWRLPDMDTTNSYIASLNNAHARSLGEHWRVFGESRELFMKVLQASDRLSVLSSIDFRVPVYTSLEDGKGDFLERGIRMNMTDLEAFLKRPGTFELRDRVTSSLSSHEGEFTLKLKARKKKGRHHVIRRAFLRLSPESRDKIIIEYLNFAFHPLVIDGLETIYVKRTEDIKRIRTDASSNLAKLSTGNEAYSFELVPVVHGNKLMYQPDRATLKMRHFLVPVMHWTRTPENQRTWIFDLASKEILPSAINELFTGVALEEEEIDHRLNSIVGLLVAAHFSPLITEKWPKRVGFKEGGREQYMMAAQVPVLAMKMTEQDHTNPLTGEFIANLERFADLQA